MRFWDSSALVPLLIQETTTNRMRQCLSLDAGLVVWWATEVECCAALARVERLQGLSPSDLRGAVRSLDQLKRAWHEVQPQTAVRQTARRLLSSHPLRAADALQLAAAIVAAEHRPAELEFVCLDERLAEAARREGFTLSA